MCSVYYSWVWLPREGCLVHLFRKEIFVGSKRPHVGSCVPVLHGINVESHRCLVATRSQQKCIFPKEAKPTRKCRDFCEDRKAKRGG